MRSLFQQKIGDGNRRLCGPEQRRRQRRWWPAERRRVTARARDRERAMSKHTQDEIWSLGFQTGFREVIDALGLSEKQGIELSLKLRCGSREWQGAALLPIALLR